MSVNMNTIVIRNEQTDIYIDSYHNIQKSINTSFSLAFGDSRISNSFWVIKDLCLLGSFCILWFECCMDSSTKYSEASSSLSAALINSKFDASKGKTNNFLSLDCGFFPFFWFLASLHYDFSFLVLKNPEELMLVWLFVPPQHLET